MVDTNEATAGTSAAAPSATTIAAISEPPAPQAAPQAAPQPQHQSAKTPLPNATTELKPTASGTKRKRQTEEHVNIDKGSAHNLLVVLKQHPLGDVVLRHVVNKQTLEQRLQGARLTLGAIRQHLSDAHQTLRSKQDAQQPFKDFDDFCRYAYDLIDVEEQRAALKVDGASAHMNVACKQQNVDALFTSSMAGPLFTSSTKINAQADGRPPHIYSTTILPHAPASFRALGDLVLLGNGSTSHSITQCRRSPLITGKQVVLGPFESFGPRHDHTDAMVSVNEVSTYICDKASPESSVPELSRDKPVAVSDVKGSAAQIDIALLEEFAKTLEPDDLSSSIEKLAGLQEARLRKSPLTPVPDDEQQLAREIMERLQSQILMADIKPKDLITRIRKDYTFLKYAPSYTGTLPPTVSQMVPASRLQIIPTTTVRPLSHANNKRPIEKPIYAPTKPLMSRPT